MPLTRDVPHDIGRAWHTLERREQARVFYRQNARHAREGNGHPAPEFMFYSAEHARADSNKAKNRYRDVVAYDRTGVRFDDERYLNANVVVDAAGRWWVAAQAPLPNTHYDFFRAIHTSAASRSPAVPGSSGSSDRKRNTRAIVVQLTNWVENGVPKADKYIPRAAGSAHTLRPRTGSGSLNLTLESASERSSLGATHSVLRLQSAGEPDMLVDHYLFTQWPDHGVPEGSAVSRLRGLLKEVHARQTELGGQKQCEVWVHCSAGVGRTGAFIALMSINLSSGRTRSKPPCPLDNVKIENVTLRDGGDIAATVDGMRDYRNMLVQTPEQFALIYKMSASWK